VEQIPEDAIGRVLMRMKTTNPGGMKYRYNSERRRSPKSRRDVISVEFGTSERLKSQRDAISVAKNNGHKRQNPER
jgi:hypothetical protein